MKDKLINFLELTGFSWFIPLVKLSTGESPKNQMQDLAKMVGVPIFAIVVFLLLWHMGAAKIITSLGQVPGPTQVWEQTHVLIDEHYE